jgi:hypothetical protein
LQNEAPPSVKRGRGRPKGWKPKGTIIQELTAQGVNEPWLAEKLIWVAEHGKPKERLEALDRIMALRGDIKDKNSGAATMVNTGPVMVLIGASQERMKALRGAVPQLSAERAEEERAARANERLAALKRGELDPVMKHSVAQLDKPWNNQVKDEMALPDVQSGANGPDTEAQTPEG